MPNADSVTIELLAKTNGFDTKIKQSANAFDGGMNRISQSAGKAERAVDRSTRAQIADIQALERSIRSASGAAATIKGLAGTLAAAFSVRQVVGLIDSFTRFQNQLRVAGLEGEQLAQTQEKLLTIAQRYGVELESLGTLYGRGASAAKELGLSQADQLRITEATSAALQISGASAASASGALLQLSQVLGGSKVQAEEYNSLIDALRPLLQGVADGSDKWKGSVAKLTASVKDGKVSVDEFVTALLKGSQGVIDKAATSTLTLSGAFQKLTNALTIYVGQSAQVNGVTGAVAGAMDLLADNLDTVADALAVIAAVMLGRFVSGAVASTAATIALSAAAAGATTRLGAMGAAGAVAGRGLLAAFGGPVGIAVTALTVGIGYLVLKTQDGVKVAEQYKRAQAGSTDANNKLREAIDTLATAHGKARTAALAEAHAQRENAIQKRNSAKASLDLARAELARVKAFEASVIQDPGLFDPGAVIAGSQAEQKKGNAAVSLLQKTISDTDKLIAAADRALKAPEAPRPAGVSEGKKDKKGKEATGPTAAEIAQRHNEELSRLRGEEINAQINLTENATLRADLQKELIAEERAARIAQVENDEHFTKAQKAAQIEYIQKIYGTPSKVDAKTGDIITQGRPGLLSQIINSQEEKRIREESLQAAEDLLDNRLDVLRAEEDTALTQDERRRLALEILDVEYEKLENTIRQNIAEGEAAGVSEEILAAQRERLANLGQLKAAATKDAKAKTAGSFESYMDGIQRTADDLDSALEDIATGSMENLIDGLSQAAAGFKSFGDVARDAIQSLTADVVKLVLKMLLLKAIKAIAGVGFAGGGSTEGLATGGQVGFARGGQVGFPTGGLITGPGTSTSDSIPGITATGRPIRVSDGEYIVRGAVVRKVGVSALDQLNATGRMPHGYAGGGALRTFAPANGSATAPGGNRVGIDDDFKRELRSALGEAAAMQRPVHVGAYLTPKAAMEAMLSDPGSQRLLFDFMSNNSGSINSNLRR